MSSSHERALKIKSTLKAFGKTMHPSKKAAPGISYEHLTSKEKHYRKDNEKRTHARLKRFDASSYGQHLKARAARRGEED